MDDKLPSESVVPTDEEKPWVQLTRRSVIGGLGGTLIVPHTALSGDCKSDDDELILGFADDSRNVAKISYRSKDGKVCEQLDWKRTEFGANARFEIERKSEIVWEYKDDNGKTIVYYPNKPNTDGAIPTWRPAYWSLQVLQASFPGGKPHRLTFDFKRRKILDKASSTGFEPWTVMLTRAGWPSSPDLSRAFGDPLHDGVEPLELSRFLTSGGAEGRLTTALGNPVARGLLAELFGERIESDGSISFALDRDLVWQADAATNTHLYILAFPLRFRTLRIERLLAEDETPRVVGQPSATAATTGKPATSGKSAANGQRPDDKADPAPRSAKPQRLLGEEAQPTIPGKDPTPPSVGLYGEVIGTANLPERAGTPAFEFGFHGSGETRIVFDLTLGDLGGLRAALRHWGKPDRTVAGLTLGDASDCNPLKTRARLSIVTSDTKGAEARSTFELSALEIVRQKDVLGRVRTELRGTPTGKEHTIHTPFGPADMRAAPAVSGRPGRAARVPRLLARMEDKGSNDQRELVAFEAVLSLVSLGVRLPESIDRPAGKGTTQEKPGEHVTRLEFADAECRLMLPALESPAQPVLADAVIPIGFRPSHAPDRRALIDLGRARLSVLRPSDLLSLSYRFAGLSLDLPVLERGGAATKPARIVTRSGPHLCRALSPPTSAGAAAGHPTGDDRPLLIVEFPPQHVAEQAIFRQIQAPYLPKLEGLDQPTRDVAEALALLRKPKPRRGDDATGERRKRLDARRTIDAAIGMQQEDATKAFRENFATRAAKANLPSEQRIYLGSEFLDDDSRKLALALLRPAPEPMPDELGQPPDVALPDAVRKDVLEAFGRVAGSSIEETNPKDWPVSDALERAKGQRNAAYGAFREAYERRVRSLQSDDEKELAQYRGAKWFNRYAIEKLDASITCWTLSYKAPTTSDTIPERTEARLSGPSRLAFRVNCDEFQPERAGGGFDFSLEALTNWGGMDLAVVRRAERLFQAPKRGPMPPRWGRTLNLDEADNLAFQGISRGDHLAIAEDKRLKGRAPSVREKAAGFFFGPSRVTPRQRLTEVAASARTAPDLFQTAIELPFRLFLSPAQDSTWLTPNAAIHRKVFPDDTVDIVDTCRELWSATLGGSGVEAGVRAVWSPDFRPEALLSIDEPGSPPSGDYAPWSLPRSLGDRSSPTDLEGLPRFLTSLDASDRHELVALSSVPGMPVLGRRDIDGSILGGSQFDPPDGFRLAGMAVDAPVAKGDKQPLSPGDYSAIYRPQPLSISELSLTALGGNLNVDTTFTPPASAKLKNRNNLYDAFTIERWRHRTVLGRDVLVEVVYKGFLFPIGHKATLVKVTERRFEAGSPDGRPVAVLIQRKFLRVGEPVKAFPAYDHPNEARRWPCERVTMLTRRTPDLVDPDGPGGGRIILKDEQGQYAPGRVFWPRTARRNEAVVRFQMLIDDESAPVSMPLVFVDNRAANDSAAMALLVDWYNGTGKPENASEGSPTTERRMPRNGQPVRMAPASKPGDTSFETDWWDLKAEGRQSGTGPVAPKDEAIGKFKDVKLVNRYFERDPFMEGLDQPAFYPVCDAARCRLTPVERFTGSPNNWAVVSYDGYYAAHGFDESKKGEIAQAGEVYLRLITGYDGYAKPLRMRMQSGDRSGGVGQPNLDIVGLSRASGPVGQAEATVDHSDWRNVTFNEASLGEKATDAGAAGTTLPSLAAHTGVPSAATMFPQDAKLLGLVPLSVVLDIGMALKDQPVLKEIVEYGAASGAAAGAEARAFITERVLAPILTAVTEIESQWKAIATKDLATLPGQKDLSLDEAYPQLGAALARLREQITATVSGSTDDVTFFAGLAAVYEAGRTLVDTVSRILRDPLASVSEAQITKLKQAVAEIKAVADGIPDMVARAKKALVDTVVGELRSRLLGAEARAWRRTLFALPLPKTAIPAGLQEAFDTAVDKAVVATLDRALSDLQSGTPENVLKDLPGNFVAELGDAARHAQAKVHDSLEEIADRIVEEGQERLAAIAAPRLRAVVADIHTMVEAGTVLERGIAAGLAEAAQAIATSLPAILDALADLLGGSTLAPLRKAANDACKAVGDDIVKLLANLARALLPPASAGGDDCAQAARTLARFTKAAPDGFDGSVVDAPKMEVGDTIGLDEGCEVALHVVTTLAKLEADLSGLPSSHDAVQKLRIDLATCGQRLAAGLARLQEARARVDQWAAAPGTTCDALAGAAVVGANGLIAARDEVLACLHGVSEESFKGLFVALSDADTVIPAVAQAITASVLSATEKTSLRTSLAEAADALTRTARASIRLLRSITLLATVLQDGEGSKTGADDRKKRLKDVSDALKDAAKQAGLPEGNPLTAAASLIDGAQSALEQLEDDTRQKAATLQRALIATGLDEQNLDAKITEAVAAWKEARATADRVRKEIEKAIEAKATEVAATLIVAAAKSLSQLDNKLGTAVKSLVELISKAYVGLVEGRQKLLAKFNAQLGTSANADPLLASILKLVVTDRLAGQTSPLVVECAPAEKAACNALPGNAPKDRLALEANALTSAVGKLDGNSASLLAAAAVLKPVFGPFDDNRPLALPTLAQQFSRINADFVRTLVLSAVDLKAIKREIESRIRDLIPARVVLPYALDNELKNFPSDDPIFQPVPGTRLSLTSRTTVHLLPRPDQSLPPPPEFNVTGEVGPFAINLLGKQTFDVVTINFTGLSFAAGSGRSPSFAVHFKNVELGEKASFLKPLQDYLSPKSGGFYLKVLQGRPGLEAGYGINLGIIGVGTLSFSNVILNAAARLPFDAGGEARFVVSIGRSDAPFLISSTIFGGGGYLALIASSKAIVGFEASFDYGGVAAFGFGPLQGMGRITMGIYLHKEDERTSLGATFFAGGSAHIACFGFSTSLLVRLIQNDGEPMYGSATFTFSFSLGIHDIEFEVMVEKNAGPGIGSKGDGSDQKTGWLEHDGPVFDLDGRPTSYAALSAKRARAHSGPARAPIPPRRPPDLTTLEPVKDPGPRLRVEGVTLAKDWKAYGSYFEDALRPAGLKGAAL